MKTLSKILAGGLLAFTFSAVALPPPQNWFCVGSTNPYVADGHVIISPRSGNGGPPVVMSLCHAADTVAGGVAKVTAYLVNTNFTCTNGAGFGSSTAVYFPAIAGYSNQFAAGDNVVYYHTATDLCERRIVSAVLLTNILNFTVALNVAPTNGDVIYRVTNFAAPRIVLGGVSTNTICTGSPLFVGQAGYPLLISLPGQTAGGVLSAAGFYAAPPGQTPVR